MCLPIGFEIHYFIYFPTPLYTKTRCQAGFCVFYAFFLPAKASPFGRGGCEADGEGRPGMKKPLHSDGQTLCKSDAIVAFVPFVSALALSGAARQLSQGESQKRGGQAKASPFGRGGTVSAVTERARMLTIEEIPIKRETTGGTPK